MRVSAAFTDFEGEYERVDGEGEVGSTETEWCVLRNERLEAVSGLYMK